MPSAMSTYRPHAASARKIALPALRARLVDLPLKQVVVDGLLDVPEHADGGDARRGQRQAAEREGQAGLGVVLVVDEQCLLPHVRDGDDLRGAVVPDAHAALALHAEARGLAVLQVDAILLGFAHRVEGAVVVDVAVLKDLDESCPAMRGCPSQHFRDVLAVGVDRARDEARLGADGDAERVERLVDRACGRRARPLAARARRRVLALRQPVDLVVEEQDGDVHVAPQRVDEVVTADRQRVAVAGHDPH